MEKILKFFKDEDGMELSEYAVVGGILLAGAVGVILIWGQNIVGVFTTISDAVTGQSLYAWRNLDGIDSNNPGYMKSLTTDNMQTMWDNGWTVTAVLRLEQTGHFFSWNTSTIVPNGTYVANRRRGVSLGVSGGGVVLTPQGGSSYTVSGALAQSFVKIVLSAAPEEE